MVCPTALSTGPLRVVRAARSAGYSQRVSEYEVVTPAGRTLKGDPYPERRVVHLDVRGWRRTDGRRFAVRWRDGKADSAWWWTRVHTATATEPEEEIAFTSTTRQPVRIGITDLKFMIEATKETR
jgi:hypothetical protein